jgi:CBS domain-containing protein
LDQRDVSHQDTVLGWHDFYLAGAGASSTFVGPLFVGLSQHTRIRKSILGSATALRRSTCIRIVSASAHQRSSNQTEGCQMSGTVKDVMSASPVGLDESATIVDAARAMRERDFGSVIVLKSQGGSVLGVVTDRDIVIRAVAEGRDPNSVTLGEICSSHVTTVSSDQSVSQVADLMREKAIRRVPVVDKGRLVGIVSLGDIAKVKDEGAALSDISAAPPNN